MDFVTHIYGLGFYVKGRLPFAWDSYLCLLQVLVHSLSYLFCLLYTKLPHDKSLAALNTIIEILFRSGAKDNEVC